MHLEHVANLYVVDLPLGFTLELFSRDPGCSSAVWRWCGILVASAQVGEA